MSYSVSSLSSDSPSKSVSFGIGARPGRLFAGRTQRVVIRVFLRVLDAIIVGIDCCGIKPTVANFKPVPKTITVGIVHERVGPVCELAGRDERVVDALNNADDETLQAVVEYCNNEIERDSGDVDGEPQKDQDPPDEFEGDPERWADAVGDCEAPVRATLTKKADLGERVPLLPVV